MPIAEQVDEVLRKRILRAARERPGKARQRHAPPEPGPPVSFNALLSKAERLVDKRFSTFEQFCSTFWSPAQMYSAPLFERGASIDERHAIIDRIRADALQFTPRPHAFQIDLIEFWLELGAPYIYGEFWQTDYISIKKRNGWITPNNGVGAVRSGRKDGKSTGIAMCVTLGLFNLTSYTIALFAKVREQSRIILGLVIELSRTHPRYSEFYVPRPSRDRFIIRGGANDERVVQAHSGDPNVR